MKVEDALQQKERRKQAPTRKIHAKHNSDDNIHLYKNLAVSQPKEKPQKLESRPEWNQRKRKTAVKNSEKDPLYLKKREEAELRKERREQRLLYLQELNKDRIPTHSNRSPGKGHYEFAEDVKQIEDRGSKVVATNRAWSEKQETDISHKMLSNGETRLTSKPPENTGRSSPPIPAVRHRTTMKNESNKDPYQYANNYLQLSPADSKYGDAALFPTGDEFVPFMRTAEILDPARADEPMIISRENSKMERARNAYFEINHPANKGKRLDVYRDQDREATRKVLILVNKVIL